LGRGRPSAQSEDAKKSSNPFLSLSDSAVVEPKLKTQHLIDDLLHSWEDLLITLEEWTSLFSLAQERTEDLTSGVKFSLKDIKVKDGEETTALAFKTPMKRKYMEDP